MNKQAAINLIADTFNSSFNENRFRHFIRNLFNEFDENKNASWITGYIKDSFKDHVKKYKRIGKYKDIDGNKMDVVVVHLRKESALDSARTMQRNFIASYLKTRGEKDAAVVAYFTDNTDDWRFSYVRMEYRQEITESGKIKVKEEFTPRRYSFLVGKNEPNHTAQQQLFPILCDDQNNPSLSELEKAFSVEVVTRQFYQDYKGLFEKLTEELDRILEEDNKIKREFESKAIVAANFAKKLLGQIVFLYFLQKKGWLGVPKDERWGKGNKKFLRTLFKNCIEKNGNFFNDYLEYLFYEALATTEGRTTIDLSYYQKFDCKIPFLNGGLFEPINDYSWQETDIHINNDLFAEIFDTFDRYNFTVREDEPLEKEVAVDPEMLGKVFENLLPGNLRKGQGAYYTPREIVHYMCQESLINYLDTAVNTGEISLTQEKPTQGKLFGTPKPKQLGLKTTGYKTVIPRKDIENFICKGEFAIEHDTAKEEGTTSYKYQVDESIRKNAQLLDEKLKTIKICDPAIGSGAFPVGMMHEIIKARNVLTTYIDDKTKRNFYEFKRNCIQQSLYGVDIDPGAIDIAKLRLWLSLIVDEDDYLNIKPLPNLDYKIMQGNSLIEEFHGISLNLEKEKKNEKPVNMQLFNDNKDLDKLIENLHNKQDRLFLATHLEEKQLLKRKVEDAVVEIFHYELQRSNEEYFRELRAVEDKVKIIPKKDKKEYYDKEKAKLDKRYKFDFTAVENELREMTRGNKIRNFFPWKLYFADVFRKNGGFDVVIANPPYGIVFDPTSKHRYEKKYSTFLRNNDIYVAFYEQGINTLVANGVLVYISPNTFLNGDYFKRFRELLTSQTIINEITDYKEYPIFDDPTVFVCILSCTKRPSITYPYGFSVRIARNSLKYFVHKKVVINNASNKSFKPENQLLVKMLKIDNVEILDNLFFVKDVGFNYWTKGRGKKRGGNSIGKRVFYRGEKRHKHDIPFLKGRDIERYYFQTPNNFLKHDYEKFLNDTIDTFRFSSNFLEITPKIIYRQTSNKITATIDNQSTSLDKTVHLIVSKPKGKSLNLRFVLALLNSSLFNYFYKYISQERKGRPFAQVKTTYIKQLPVKSAPSLVKQPFIALVDQILSLKKSNPKADTSALEAEIDRMVYKLYDLTEDEIATVEESAGRR